MESHPPGQQEIPKPLILRDVGPADHPRHRVEPHHGVDSFSESSIESYTERMSEVSEGRCPEDRLVLVCVISAGEGPRKWSRCLSDCCRNLVL